MALKPLGPDAAAGLVDALDLLDQTTLRAGTRAMNTSPESGWTGWDVPSDLRIAFADGTVSITAVPEPGAWSLMLAGLGAVVWLARRRQTGSSVAAAA